MDCAYNTKLDPRDNKSQLQNISKDQSVLNLRLKISIYQDINNNNSSTKEYTKKNKGREQVVTFNTLPSSSIEF